MSSDAYETLREPVETAIVAVLRTGRIPVQDAGDFANECRMHVFQRADVILASFTAAANPGGLLFRVCRNCWLDIRRSRNGRRRRSAGPDALAEPALPATKTPLHAQPAPDPDPEECLLIKERQLIVIHLMDALRAGLATLDRVDAEIIARRYWGHENADTIAAALEIRRSRVYDRPASIKARLRRFLISAGYDASLVQTELDRPDVWDQAGPGARARERERERERERAVLS